MNFLLLDVNLRSAIVLFLLIGLLMYVVDYRHFKNKQAYAKEATFSKVASYIYIFGGIAALVALQIISWFS